MKIAVTGGAGFIGSHITDMLIDKGHDVCVIDSLVHGKMENLNPKADFYKVDIRDGGIEEIFKKEKFDMLFHEAAQISVHNSVENPMLDADVNIRGSLNLLEACRKSGVKKVIYPASAAIFGEPEYLPIDENHPLNMMCGYGVSKHTVEHYLKVYRKLYGLNYTVLRYANVYGPRQDSTGEGGVVAIFCERLINSQDTSIYGDGEQTRDFVYVKDAAMANILSMDGGDGCIYNVCTGDRISVNRLLHTIADITGAEAKPVYKDEREGDIKHSYMTYEKINKALNWEPKYSLKEGLTETLRYYQSNVK